MLLKMESGWHFSYYVKIIVIFNATHLTHGVTVALSKGSLSGAGTNKCLQLVARLKIKQSTVHLLPYFSLPISHIFTIL